MKLAPLFVALVVCAAPVLAAAAESNLLQGRGPVNIEAESLEWRQKENLYLARGNAKASRGDNTITADLLLAHERPTAETASKNGSEKAAASGLTGSVTGTGGEIYKFEAEGNVRLQSPGYIVEGDRALYDVDRRVAVVTGQNLRVVGLDDRAADLVTARDSLEYWEVENLVLARGAASAQRGERRVDADELVALLAKDANGQTQIERVEAKGQVRVSNGKGLAMGEQGLYDMAKNKAILTGNVRITQEGSQMQGDAAEVDFNTGISRLIAANAGDHSRVRALLQPKKAKAP